MKNISQLCSIDAVVKSGMGDSICYVSVKFLAFKLDVYLVENWSAHENVH